MWLRVLVMWCLAGLVQGSHYRKGNSCSQVQQRCMFRDGCSTALTNYMLWCSEVMGGNTKCSVPCQNALIALTSTEEGKELMNVSIQLQIILTLCMREPREDTLPCSR